VVLSQLSYSPTCVQESILSDFPPRCQSAHPESTPHSRTDCAPWGTPAAGKRGAGNPFETMKFFSALPINALSKSPGSGGKTLLTRWRRGKKYFPSSKPIGGNNVETRSPFRMESTRRSPRDPLRTCARESALDKVPRGVNALPVAESPPRKGRFSGIANRPHVIRDHRVNIKKVHGIRHFPVDTENAIF
jgi:hypothetical protein